MSRTDGAERQLEPTVDVETTATDPNTVGRATVDATVEREPAGRLWIVFAVVGVVALGVAIVLTALPGLLQIRTDPVLVRQFRAAAPLLGAAVGALGLYGLYARYDGELDDESAVELPAKTPERMRGVEQRVVGSELDDLLGTIDGRVDPYDGLEASYAADIRRELRTTARRALVNATGMAPERAEEAIETGAWTDDPRAAAFLGGDGVADPPVELQLRDWASGESFDRRVDATIDAIRRLDRGDRP